MWYAGIIQGRIRNAFTSYPPPSQSRADSGGRSSFFSRTPLKLFAAVLAMSALSGCELDDCSLTTGAEHKETDKPGEGPVKETVAKVELKCAIKKTPPGDEETETRPLLSRWPALSDLVGVQSLSTDVASLSLHVPGSAIGPASASGFVIVRNGSGTIVDVRGVELHRQGENWFIADPVSTNQWLAGLPATEGRALEASFSTPVATTSSARTSASAEVLHFGSRVQGLNTSQ